MLEAVSISEELGEPVAQPLTHDSCPFHFVRSRELAITPCCLRKEQVLGLDPNMLCLSCLSLSLVTKAGSPKTKKIDEPGCI